MTFVYKERTKSFFHNHDCLSETKVIFRENPTPNVCTSSSTRRHDRFKRDGGMSVGAALIVHEVRQMRHTTLCNFPTLKCTGVSVVKGNVLKYDSFINTNTHFPHRNPINNKYCRFLAFHVFNSFYHLYNYLIPCKYITWWYILVILDTISLFI